MKNYQVNGSWAKVPHDELHSSERGEVKVLDSSNYAQVLIAKGVEHVEKCHLVVNDTLLTAII